MFGEIKQLLSKIQRFIISDETAQVILVFTQSTMTDVMS